MFLHFVQNDGVVVEGSKIKSLQISVSISADLT